FYCLPLDNKGNVMGYSDLGDTWGTFIENPELFKWTFSDESFIFQKGGTSALRKHTLFFDLKTGSADRSCLFALSTQNGSVRWKQEMEGDLQSWTLSGKKLVGYTEQTMFILDDQGKGYTTIDCPEGFHPISNIVFKNK